jgi:hypothetical protein
MAEFLNLKGDGPYEQFDRDAQAILGPVGSGMATTSGLLRTISAIPENQLGSGDYGVRSAFIDPVEG